MWIRLALGILMVGALAVTSEAEIVFDLRAVEGGNGVDVYGPKEFGVTWFSGVLKLQIWAMITNANGNNDDEGFRQTHLSLMSYAGTPNLRGDYVVVPDPPGPETSPNNVAPFNGLGAHPGVAADLDGDGDMDIGDLRTTGGDITKYFVPSAGASPVTWDGVSAGGKAAERAGGQNYSSFLLGTFDWSFQDGFAPGGVSAQLNLVPRVKLDGLASSRLTHAYQQDGVRFAYNGEHAQVRVGAPVRTNVIPEPSTIALVGVGLLGVAVAVRRRRA